MRSLPAEFRPYTWALPSDEVARLAGIDRTQVVRYDQNTPPMPLRSSRPGAIAAALASVNSYPPGGYRALREAIAAHSQVEPGQVVLGAGADDLILLCARCFAGPGDRAAIPADPTYPLYRLAVQLAGAEVGDDDPVLTFTCRPNSPDGALRPLPEARPLVCDEAYYEYCGLTALGLLDEGVIVLRTFSKAFGLAGARIGYALADRELADELNARQAPAPVSGLSAALALAALNDPPDVAPVVEERERLAVLLAQIGLRPLPSQANFLFCPHEDAGELGDGLLRQGLVVRVYSDGIRITIRDRVDDDLICDALARLLDRPSPVAATEAGRRRVRHLRASAETRIAVRLGLDGESRVSVRTGSGVYDHLLEQLAFHAGFDLEIEADGDLETGDHHTVEDTALALGEALDQALGDRRGIARYGSADVPMDDALARVAVDLGGRPYAELAIDPDVGLAGHFFTSLAQAARLAVHVQASGADAHHTSEAAYKACGRALRAAVRVEGAGLPSTKGIL